MRQGDTRALVFHLFRWAGFGPRPEEPDHFTSLGVQGSMVTQSGYDDYADEVSAHPKLLATDPDNENLKFTTDFRSVYSSVLAHWMGADPTAAVLGALPTIPFV